MSKPRLLFVSPVFLFPNDAGGKIRTTNILRGMRSGAFDITLMSPATPEQRARHAAELDSVAGEFIAWRPAKALPRWRRAIDLIDDLPVNVAADRSREARLAVRQVLQQRRHELVVFDFVHSAVLAPRPIGLPSVCFTHNVEAEIFQRHAEQAQSAWMRHIWRAQHGKMQRFERRALGGFDTVIAVSERDARAFREQHGLKRVEAIPTGVDLDRFQWALPPTLAPGQPPTVVFTGAMNWDANIDGVNHFLDEVWPLILAGCPEARFVIVGREPSAALRARAASLPGVSCTGFVDDVRPYVHAAQAFVIPLRVGGGTRIKAFEAMAMGCPVVSTAIGMEGLDVHDGAHYLCRDTPEQQAQGVLSLLRDPGLRERLSRDARRRVEDFFGHTEVARVFERICLATLHPEAHAVPAAERQLPHSEAARLPVRVADPIPDP